MIIKSNKIVQRLKRTQKNHKKDPLAIVPLPNLTELENSGAASIDLRLGTWFLTFRQTRCPILDIYKTNDPRQNESELTKTHYVRFGDQFVLHPNNFVLGTTLEWIRLPNDLAGYVIGKSSWGRRGLIIATAAGVHPGFTGCLTLELTNVGVTPIIIKPGLLICQLFLHNVDSDTDDIGKSDFIGKRRPVLGEIKPDEIAKILATD